MYIVTSKSILQVGHQTMAKVRIIIRLLGRLIYPGEKEALWISVDNITSCETQAYREWIITMKEGIGALSAKLDMLVILEIQGVNSQTRISLDSESGQTESDILEAEELVLSLKVCGIAKS